MDLKLEVVVRPVADVDRAKAFYTERLGFRLDADFPVDDGYRVVQVTPPGSECSIIFGSGVTAPAPGGPWMWSITTSAGSRARSNTIPAIEDGPGS
ncbi:VOC family protein [Nocardia gipuzkoensis]